MSSERLTLGIFGFGCVGSGLYETLRESSFNRAQIKKICIKDPNKSRTAPYALFTTRAEEILNDPEINVVVELIDDVVAAHHIVTTALRKGKAVVTANKKLIAEHLEELIALQRATGGSLLYEAACAASIPIIRNLEEYYDNDLLSEVSGVLNGSTNFILSAIEGGGIFDAALELAQELGYAETDPTLDVEGWDAKYKTTLLLAHAFGLVVDPDEIYHTGITRVTEELQQVAIERRQKIKLVGKCWRENDRAHAYVLPTFVDSDEDLAAVEKEVNGITVVGAFSEKQFFRGKGAGSLPTAAAVMSDISALTYGYRYEYKKSQTKGELKYSSDVVIWAHVSGLAKDELPREKFEVLSKAYSSSKHNYVEGKIHLADLVELARDGRWAIAVLSSATQADLEELNYESIATLNEP